LRCWLSLFIPKDPPRGQEFWIPVDSRFEHAVDLVSYIRSTPEFSSEFCVGVAGPASVQPNDVFSPPVCSSLGYPDGQPDQETDEDGELEHLKRKIDAGADFIVTQLFYDVDGFLKWMDKVRKKG
jgi:methylenetetrahydrofolate reductase (NADPH)